MFRQISKVALVVLVAVGSPVISGCGRDSGEIRIVEIPKDPDPYNGGIQLDSGWRVWGDMNYLPALGNKSQPTVDITFENRSGGDLVRPPLGDDIRVVDDRGNIYRCTNMDRTGTGSGQVPRGSHAFTRFTFDFPKPGFQWLMIEVPAKHFQSTGRLGYKISAATVDQRNEFVRQLNR